MIVIVGAGITGLYLGRLIPECVIFESGDRVGGRAGNVMFEGVSVPIGAGIVRQRDINLIKLAKQLKVPLTPFKSKVKYTDEFDMPISLMEIFKYLKDSYNGETGHFKSYGIDKLGIELYNYFVKLSGYTDYEHEDVYETLHHYGMEDNEAVNGFYINWQDLIQKMKQGLDIRLNQPVRKIRKRGNQWLVNGILADKVIMTVPINQLNKIIKVNLPLASQPFLRIYGKLDTDVVDKHTITYGKLHRIIPMGNNVSMIAYTDGNDALDVNRWNVKKLEQELGKIKPVKIKKYIKFFWEEGTHYWKRRYQLDKAHKLGHNLYYAGEGVSHNQGWVEGAIESAERLYRKFIC
jgi:hypothetical protein